mgnify:CR=1 FL=1
MAYRLPNLTWLRAFEATARLSSFTAAAEELHLTQPAISYQVRALEGHLGFKLFHRTPGRLHLTEMGEAYLPRIRQAFEDISATTAGLFGKPGDRIMTVRAPVSTATMWIGPALGSFRAAYPEIEIRLCSAIWAEQLGPEEIDVDIRLGNGNWQGCRTQLIQRDTAVPITAARNPSPPTRLKDFTSRPLLHIMGYQDFWMRLFRAGGLVEPSPSSGITVDTSLTAIEMIVQGVGDAMVMRCIAANAISEGRVVRPPGLELTLEDGHYFVMPDDGRRPKPEASLFMDWVMDELVGG